MINQLDYYMGYCIHNKALRAENHFKNTKTIKTTTTTTTTQTDIQTRKV